MKVVIINSPLFRDKNPRYDEDSLPPIGLGWIATALKDQKVDVSLIDAVAGNIHLRELVSALTAEKPDFICTNVFTTNFELVKEFVEAINFKTHFIIGGLSTKTLYPEIFKWTNANPIDIIHGDGELITVDIVFNLYQKKFKKELADIQKEMQKSALQVSNLQECVETVVKFAGNLKEMWHSGAYQDKVRQQYLLFPDGIRYNKQTNQCRTTKIKKTFLWMLCQSKSYSKNKIGIPQLNLRHSDLVEHPGRKSNLKLLIEETELFLECFL